MRVLVLALILATAPAVAHDGYESLIVPKTGGSCCGGQDCAPTETRTGDHGQLQAHIVRPKGWNSYAEEPAVDLWADVPPEAVLPASENPKVGPSACWVPSLGIICFLPGRGV